jgi:hypothetical protein
MTKSPFSSSSAAWKHRRIDPKLDFGIGLLGIEYPTSKSVHEFGAGLLYPLAASDEIFRWGDKACAEIG